MERRSRKTAVIVPLYRKGEKEDPKNYRGISLLSTAYKVYTEVIRRKLEEEVEEKKLLPEGQAGFRKGRSMIDNIYVLDHITGTAKLRTEKLYALFVDLKAAFDTVKREKLWKILLEMGISKFLVERLKGVYEETKSRIRTNREFSEEFWTSKGLRQGCLLSPILFCLYIAGLEEEYRKRGIGGINIGQSRIWSLAYADDIVLIGKNREAIKDMMNTLKKFLKERSLILSVEKTKMMVFNKTGKERKEEWRWEGKKIEEVEKFTYLGFTFNRGGNYKDHIRNLKKKGIYAAKKAWSLGERKCRNDFKRKMMLFEYLVRSTMEYGVEIWGYEGIKELERIKTDYFRWVLGLDFCTPRYVVYEESNNRELKTEWTIRAMRYEERIRKLEEDRLTKICWEE